jgi:hypothetical protein
MKPTLPTLTRTTPECASDLTFDRWQAKELSAMELAKLDAHMTTCDRCKSRGAAIAGGAAAFDATAPAWLKGGATRASPLSRLSSRTVMLSGALALAAALLFVVRSKAPAPPEMIEPTERIKGGSGHIGYHVKHADSVRVGTDGDRLTPGDAIQFSYTTSRPQHLAILSVDGAMHVTKYFPRSSHAASIAPGEAADLDESIVLDETLGDETIYALFCSDAIDIAPVQAALERSPRSSPEISGCHVDRIHFVKVGR